MQIHLTPELQQKVDQIIELGRFKDAETVIDASLRLLLERGNQHEWLRNELRIGEDQDARGETVEYTPETMERLIQQADERSRRGLPVRDAVKPKS